MCFCSLQGLLQGVPQLVSKVILFIFVWMDLDILLRTQRWRSQVLFFKKIWTFSKKVLPGPRPGSRLILVSNSSPWLKPFELRITSDGKPGLKNSFPMLDLRCGEVQGQDGVHPIILSSKSWTPTENLNMFGTRMSLYLGLSPDNTFFENVKFFFKKPNLRPASLSM